MRYSLLTQVGLIGMSVIVFVTVISPMFAEITTIQDERIVYEDAVNKAQQFNLRLQELVAIRDSFSREDMTQLELLLPDKVDVPKVMRDIESMFRIRNVEISTLDLAESSQEVVYVGDNLEAEIGAESPLVHQDFRVSFKGSYEDLKGVLSLAETNETLLEVVDLTFGTVAVEGQRVNAPIEQATEGEFNFVLVFRSYGLTASSL